MIVHHHVDRSRTVLRHALSLLFLVAALGVPACENAPGAESDQQAGDFHPGPILFIATYRDEVTGRIGRHLLYSMSEDGSHAAPVFGDSLLDVTDARWSRDGTRIVLTTPGNDGICIVDAHTGEITRPVYRSEGAEYPLHGRDPVWSPDSRQLVFTDQVGPEAWGVSGIFIADLNTQTVREWELNPAIAKRVSDWSPDGSVLAGDLFDWSLRDSSGRYIENTRVALFDRSGSVLSTWGENGQVYHHPIYSRAGDRIAFIRGGRSQGVYTMRIGAESDTVLVEPVYRYNQPVAWSPDDRRLLYNAGPDDLFRIMLIDLNTKTVKDITPDVGHGYRVTAVSWH